MLYRLSVWMFCLLFVLSFSGFDRGESEQTEKNYRERRDAYIAQGHYRARTIEASNAMASSPNTSFVLKINPLASNGCAACSLWLNARREQVTERRRKSTMSAS